MRENGNLTFVLLLQKLSKGSIRVNEVNLLSMWAKVPTLEMVDFRSREGRVGWKPTSKTRSGNSAPR